MERQIFRLAHDEARRRAIAAVTVAPDGYIVRIAPPTRTLEQNALMWPILECFSRQKTWIVNGAECRLDPEDWKDLLTASFKNEVRIAQSLDGRGVVLLGQRTSRFSGKKMSDFIDYVLSQAAELGVNCEQ